MHCEIVLQCKSKKRLCIQYTLPCYVRIQTLCVLIFPLLWGIGHIIITNESTSLLITNLAEWCVPCLTHDQQSYIKINKGEQPSLSEKNQNLRVTAFSLTFLEPWDIHYNRDRYSRQRVQPVKNVMTDLLNRNWQSYSCRISLSHLLQMVSINNIKIPSVYGYPNWESRKCSKMIEWLVFVCYCCCFPLKLRGWP